MSSGIYKIQSICKPERCYIGSTLNFKNRWGAHLRLLRKNKHGKLQNHFNKYGESDLIFIPIEPYFLIVREQFYIDTLNPYFNICRIAGSILGIKRTEATRQKIIKSNKGNQNMLGKHHSEESLEKMRKPKSEEAKQNMRIGWVNRKLSPDYEERIMNLSKIMLNNKIGVGNKSRLGKYHSDVSKLKMSKSRIGNHNALKKVI